MKRFAWTVIAAFSIAGLSAAAACGDDSETTNPTGAGSCVPTDPACPALAVTSDCLGLVDNNGQDEFALRLSQLEISAPAVLASPAVKTIVADGVNINLPACNVPGDGTFSFILQFNRSTDKLVAGGAFPEADPADGYCFVTDAANNVAPVEVDANLNADGTFSTAPLPLVTMPIYVDLEATGAVYLPLREAQISSAQISSDQNCIGRFNGAGLEPVNNCLPDAEKGIDYYINGASLDGYITLEDADAVIVDVLAQSLCVLLSGDTVKFGDDGSPKHCKRDGTDKIIFEGDWCSTTNSAGGCKDAVKLAAELAASSVKVRTSGCP